MFFYRSDLLCLPSHFISLARFSLAFVNNHLYFGNDCKLKIGPKIENSSHVRFNFAVWIQQINEGEAVRKQVMPNVSGTELDIAVQNIEDASNDKCSPCLERF